MDNLGKIKDNLSKCWVGLIQILLSPDIETNPGPEGVKRIVVGSPIGILINTPHGRVRTKKVTRNSPAYKAGMRENMTITAFGENEIPATCENVEQLRKYIATASERSTSVFWTQDVEKKKKPSIDVSVAAKQKLEAKNAQQRVSRGGSPTTTPSDMRDRLRAQARRDVASALFKPTTTATGTGSERGESSEPPLNLVASAQCKAGGLQLACRQYIKIDDELQARFGYFYFLKFMECFTIEEGTNPLELVCTFDVDPDNPFAFHLWDPSYYDSDDEDESDFDAHFQPLNKALLGVMIFSFFCYLCFVS